MPDALQMLRDDHMKVKELFRRFEQTEDSRTKGEIVGEALKALTIHAELEEEIFYPAMRREAGIEDDTMDEADEEHHVARVLIAELQKMRPTSSHYDAKFTVLAEAVKMHIDEEESEMLPKAAELGMGRMDELGMEMERRKMQLMQNGVRRMTSTSRRSAATTPRRSSTGTMRRRATTSGSANGRSSRTTTRTASRTRPRTAASTRAGSGAVRAASSRAKTTGSPARRSTSRTTSGGTSPRSRTPTKARSRGTTRSRR